MRVSTALVYGLVVLGIASAQQIGLNGPVQGFTFDAPTRTLRAVTGVPGAATLGPGILNRLDAAWVAPHQNYAIAFESGTCLLITSLDSTPVSTTLSCGASGEPEGVAWSADGSTAVLYSSAGNWVETITGFPQNPSTPVGFSLSALGGSVSAAASDAQGTRTAIAMSGASGGVYLTSDGKSFVPVLGSTNVVSLAFSTDGNSLYALDNKAPQLSAVNISTFGTQTLPLAGLMDPVAVQPGVDAEGRSIVYVASGSDQTLRVIDVATQQVAADVPLAVAPTRLNVLGQASFIIVSRSQTDQPLWLFSSSPQLAAYFVPAVGLEPERERKFVAGGRN